MFRFGSDAQKQEWLATLASGAKLGCFAFSEPGSGSDAAGLTTVAQREGNGYVLRGSKSFVTAASHASLAIVFAALQPGSTNSLTAFLVPMETAGVSLGLAHNKLGLRGATASSLNLKDVRIPANAVLGCEGGGLEVLGFAEEGRSIAAAAVAVGLACAAFAAATQYARTQKSNGVPIATQQTIQFKLADMSTQIDAARLLTWQAASSRDEGAPMGAQASMAKLVASEVASRVASDAVQVLGSNGCLMENAVERHFRDAKVTEIYDGTSEMQRLDIASVLLKD
jgi:alkylation response protein AidB-like acyl-CoA dehydrogenase